MTTDDGGPLLLFVGDLEERDGPDLLLRAMPAVRRLHPGARLVAAGEGTLGGALAAYARYLGLDGAFDLEGAPDDHRLAALAAAADAVVLPGRVAADPRVIAAARAAGKPVVATHEAAGGRLEDGLGAACVYASESALAAALSRLLGADSAT